MGRATNALQDKGNATRANAAYWLCCLVIGWLGVQVLVGADLHGHRPPVEPVTPVGIQGMHIIVVPHGSVGAFAASGRMRSTMSIGAAARAVTITAAIAQLP